MTDRNNDYYYSSDDDNIYHDHPPTNFKSDHSKDDSGNLGGDHISDQEALDDEEINWRRDDFEYEKKKRSETVEDNEKINQCVDVYVEGFEKKPKTVQDRLLDIISKRIEDDKEEGDTRLEEKEEKEKDTCQRKGFWTPEMNMKEIHTCPVCPICKKDLGMPVYLLPNKTLCECEHRVCLQCLRDNLCLNDYNKGEPKMECFICEEPLNSCYKNFKKIRANFIYEKDYDLAKTLDRRFGPIDCPRGCGVKYLRQDCSGHFATCDFTPKTCTNGCGAMSIVMAIHNETCNYRQITCKYCGEKEKLSHENNCYYKLCKCLSCEVEFYKRDGIMRYDSPSGFYCNTCEEERSTCPYCGFKTRYMGGHTRPCISCGRKCSRCDCKKTYLWIFAEKEFTILADTKEDATRDLCIYMRNNCYSVDLELILAHIKSTVPKIKPNNIKVPYDMLKH